MDYDTQESNTGTSGIRAFLPNTDIQNSYPRILIQRIENYQGGNGTNEQSHQPEDAPNEVNERPRLRRTKMPSARVLERRERQRAMNERIRDTFFDRINGNFFPRDQIEE